MGKKIKISENQFESLKQRLVEGSIHSNIVKQMKEYLDANYKPSENYVKEGGEYKPKKMFEINVDGELITPKALYDHMRYKFNMSEEFTKQVIRDWSAGRIDDTYLLSKNIPIK
jgi:hypothetical protein